MTTYRFSGPFLVRALGAALSLLGLIVVVLVTGAVLLSVPAGVLASLVVLSAALVVGLGAVAFARPVVVRLDGSGYRVRLVRGAGVRRAPWRDVVSAEAAWIAGERCVVIRLRDGRTTTVPVGILSGRPDDFVRDLQQHLVPGAGGGPRGSSGGGTGGSSGGRASS